MDLQLQRIEMVLRYSMIGILQNDALIKAMLKVPREQFIPKENILDTYADKHFPIPGNGRQTISAPYTYAIFYENLELKKGEKILEIGTGSGYGAAIAQEVVGLEGKVITIEINEKTYYFAKKNLRKAGYKDIMVVLGDGSEGYYPEAPYDKISITAACPEIPRTLIKQLESPGKLIGPVGPPKYILGQDLILLEKKINGEIDRNNLLKMLYVPLLGKYGWKDLPEIN
jgi:protein-L-isoaspartate(D-aspartate) O-methyltransferase